MKLDIFIKTKKLHTLIKAHIKVCIMSKKKELQNNMLNKTSMTTNNINFNIQELEINM